MDRRGHVRCHWWVLAPNDTAGRLVRRGSREEFLDLGAGALTRVFMPARGAGDVSRLSAFPRPTAAPVWRQLPVAFQK
jgi:hypothetical protein